MPVELTVDQLYIYHFIVNDARLAGADVWPQIMALRRFQGIKFRGRDDGTSCQLQIQLKGEPEWTYATQDTLYEIVGEKYKNHLEPIIQSISLKLYHMQAVLAEEKSGSDSELTAYLLSQGLWKDPQGGYHPGLEETLPRDKPFGLNFGNKGHKDALVLHMYRHNGEPADSAFQRFRFDYQLTHKNSSHCPHHKMARKIDAFFIERYNDFLDEHNWNLHLLDLEGKAKSQKAETTLQGSGLSPAR